MSPLIWLKNNLDNLNDANSKVLYFVFLWQEYNFYYNRRNENNNNKNGRNDFVNATSLKDDMRAQQAYARKRKKFVTNFSQIPSLVIKNNPRTKLYTNIDSTRYVEYQEYEKDSLEHFLTVVYKIRCNFMHGEKLRNEDEPIDVRLIGWAYDSLSELLSDINYFDNI